MAGEFAQLLPLKWRELHLPYTRIGISIAHDLVEHKYWSVDGARVEATGVAPIRISATIPLSNSIYPGAKEAWVAGTLYPGVLRKLLIEFTKKTTGYVQHPEFGEIACKPDRLDFELAGEKQDSTEVRASWVETLDDEVLHKIVSSPVKDLQVSASDLEASMTDLRALAPTLPEFSESIESLGRRITALVDIVTVLSYRGAGVVNRILYQAHRIKVAIARAKNALTWPAMQAVERIMSAAYSIRRTVLAQNGIGIYIVPADTTLAGVSLSLPKGTSIGDVIKLNPNLMRGPVIRQNTPVRYPLPPNR